MIKTNTTTSNQAGPDLGQYLRDDIQEQLGVANDGQAIAIPETTVQAPAPTPEALDVNGFTEQAEPNLTEAVALDERQQQLEAATAWSDTHGTRSAYIDDSDISKIWGIGQAERVVEGYTRLVGTDSLILPQKDHKEYVDTLRSMMGYKRDPSTISERSNFVTNKKDTPLNPAELFGHLDAYELESNDQGSFRVLPGIQILALGLVEQKLNENLTSASLISQDMMDNFSEDEIKSITGASPMDLVATESDSQLGRNLAEEWTKLLQRQAEGPDVQLDWHLDPDKEMTKEAYEQLGLWAKQTYSVAFPDILQAATAKTKSGHSRQDFVLTAQGPKILEKSKKLLVEPRVKARPQVTTIPLATTQYSKTKETTGDHYKDPKKKASLEDEARANLASVRHVINKVRLNAGMFLSLIGITQASGMRAEGNEIVVDGDAGAILGVGRETVKQINNTSEMAMIKKQSLEIEIESMDPFDPRFSSLAEKIRVLSDFAVESSTIEWKQKTYRRRASQALGMLQDIAEFRNDPISFTNYLQRGTSRIGYSSQKMNPQTHHLARQLYGSSTEYVIKPGSGSRAEQAMLITFGAHMFEESNTMPLEIYSKMRKRITGNDAKLKSIASVGRKLRAILADSDGEATAVALLNMDTNEKGNITGVGNVLETRKAFKADDDVSMFIKEAINHPNETINIIEEAVELANYMDAVQSGKHFESSMRPLEVDGISNGVASLAMQLGLTDIMYRVGVLREDPAKVIASFKGLEGNLRAALAKNMTELSLPELFNDSYFNSEFDIGKGLDDEKVIRELLDLAIQNEKLFLKPPLMTFAYGQAISSMRGLMLDAVTGNALLSQAAEKTRWGKAGTAAILHRILAASLSVTLGKDVVDFAEAIKDVTSVALIADEPILHELGTGTMTSFNSSVHKPDYEALKIQSRIKGPDNKEIRNTRFTPTKKTLGAINALNPESSTRTKILPQFTIGMDGATITNTLSGAPYRGLQEATGQKVPYVIAIYDAVVGDLGSFIPLIETVNRVWKNVTFNHDHIQGVVNGARAAHAKGKSNLSKLANTDPKGLFKNKDQSYEILSSIDKMLRTLEKGSTQQRVVHSQRAAIIKRATSAMNSSGVSSKNREMSGGYVAYMTNAEVYALYNALDAYMEVKLERLQRIATKAKANRARALKAVEGTHITQYAPDAVKRFNFPPLQ